MHYAIILLGDKQILTENILNTLILYLVPVTEKPPTMDTNDLQVPFVGLFCYYASPYFDRVLATSHM